MKMMVRVAVMGLLGVCLLAGPVPEANRKHFPPCVVKTEPANGVVDVDPQRKEIKVTFDRKMDTGRAWSWIIHRQLGAYPGVRGGPEPQWEEDGRTCVLSVRLRPDTVYAVGANSFRHTGFKSADGKVAMPYVWMFRTKKAK